MFGLEDDLSDRIHKLEDLVAKLAPALFLEKEGGGHDLGMWLDCGDIDEGEYLMISEILENHG